MKTLRSRVLGIAARSLSAWVVRPLDALRLRAEALGRGKPPGPLPRGTGDEVARVAGALEGESAEERRRCGDQRELAERLRSRSSQGAGALGQLRRGAARVGECVGTIRGAAGELDRSLGAMGANLTAIASSTSDNSASLIELSASVEEVARSSDYLAQHVATTAASVDQMVASVVEVGDRVEVLAGETDATANAVAQIGDSTREIEQSAREGVQLSGRLGEAAGEGSAAVQETLEGIHASYAAIQETARAMGDLAEASQAIGGVVKIINEINDRTKLLALNAAIIAAQAGEHGKSFAVVAHEIKNLSDRTAASTGEIARLNRGIGQRMEAAAQATAKGEEATAGSVVLAERAGHALERILATARLSHDRSQSILRATEQQTRDSERVMTSVQQVAALVGHIRNAAQEHRVTGEKVRAGAEEMRTLTGHVRIATAEQAEVSRYLSEAIAAVDHNLKAELAALRAGREDAGAIQEHLTRLREENGGQEDGMRALEALCAELQEGAGALGARAAPRAGGGGAG
ncbi:MAG: methyl-accepting chemotaxis protein [Thermodesulfobacteriota bacterium]